MRKAISTWHLSAGRVGHVHSWGVFTTAELRGALIGWGVSADDAAHIVADAEKSAPANGRGILRTSAIVAYTVDSGDPVRVVRHGSVLQ